MSAPLSRILLIVGAVVIFVLLFLAPKNAPEKSDSSENVASTALRSASGLDVFVKTAEKNLAPELLGKVEKLKAAGKFDSLVNIWSSLKRADLSSYFAEKKANQINTAAAWFDAGNRYYYSTQFTADKSEMPLLYDGAIRCYLKKLQKTPDDVDAKIMLASSYVDGSIDPMKGIGILKEIEKTDSNNVKLQLTFAFFSVKSGQLEKAISRFKKVVSLDPSYLEAYLHLADAYEQMGNKKETIAMLEQYAARSNDITSKLEVEKYIKQLKETN